MKALVLAGGSGTRLRPLTDRMPKQLIPVANRPVLEYVVGDVAAAGITEVGVVVGDWEHRIAQALGDGSRFGLRIRYLRQDRPLGLAHAVRLGRRFLGDDDFVLYLGDNLLPDGITAHSARFHDQRPAVQVVLHRVPDPGAFGVAELDQHGRVRRLVEKPRHPPSDLALVGVYFLTAAVHDAVAAIAPSGRGELEITDAIQWLVAHGADVRAVEHTGYWKDTGSAADILDSNRHLLDRLRPGVAGRVDPASELRGTVVVDPGARVVRSRIEGPGIVGAGALVQDSRIGPHTAIGRDCVVRGAELADAIVITGTPPLSRVRLRHAVVSAGIPPSGVVVARPPAR